MPNLVYRMRKSPSDFRKKLFRWFIQKKLHDFSKEFSQEGLPSMVCFSGDFVSRSIFVHGFYEREDLDAITAFLKESCAQVFKGAFVDVGANIGNHSVYFSRYFSVVVSIEPHPRTFEVLRMNLEPLGGVCINCGVGKDCGKLFISGASELNSGRTHLISEGYHDQLTVDVNTLDNLLHEVKSISLIKVDVEGMESQVFLGAKNILNQHRPVILFEQGRQEIKNGSSEAIDVLRAHGYKFLSLRRNPAAFGRRFLSWYWFRAFLLRLIKGETLEMVQTDWFEPDAYSMVVAVPKKTFV